MKTGRRADHAELNCRLFRRGAADLFRMGAACVSRRCASIGNQSRVASWPPGCRFLECGPRQIGHRIRVLDRSAAPGQGTQAAFMVEFCQRTVPLAGCRHLIRPPPPATVTVRQAPEQCPAQRRRTWLPKPSLRRGGSFQAPPFRQFGHRTCRADNPARSRLRSG